METAIVRKDFSFTEFILCFLRYATEQGVNSLPMMSARSWHELIWDIKGLFLRDNEDVARTLGEFDWNGAYPKSRELSDFQCRLFIYLGSAVNYDLCNHRITLVMCYEKRLELSEFPLLGEVVMEAYKLAENIPGFLEK